MVILPAIDLRGGRCVRLAQGDYGRETVYGDDPVAVAQTFFEEGAEWVHVVDLDAARSGVPTNYAAVRAIADRVPIKIELGGGLRDEASIEQAFAAGASRVVLGSALVKDPSFAERTLGRLGERAVAGIDARDGMVAVQGWLEGSTVRAESLAARMAEQGARRLILTDIARDGMLTGPNLDLLRSVRAACGLPIIQSGGIATLDDIDTLVAMGAEAPEGMITGRAVYEGRFTVRQAIDRAIGASAATNGV